MNASAISEALGNVPEDLIALCFDEPDTAAPLNPVQQQAIIRAADPLPASAKKPLRISRIAGGIAAAACLLFAAGFRLLFRPPESTDYTIQNSGESMLHEIETAPAITEAAPLTESPETNITSFRTAASSAKQTTHTESVQTAPPAAQTAAPVPQQTEKPQQTEAAGKIPPAEQTTAAVQTAAELTAYPQTGSTAVPVSPSSVTTIPETEPNDLLSKTREVFAKFFAGNHIAARIAEDPGKYPDSAGKIVIETDPATDASLEIKRFTKQNQIDSTLYITVETEPFAIAVQPGQITDPEQIRRLLIRFREQNSLDAAITGNANYPGYPEIVIEYIADRMPNAWTAISAYINEMHIDMTQIGLVPIINGYPVTTENPDAASTGTSHSSAVFP